MRKELCTLTAPGVHGVSVKVSLPIRIEENASIPGILGPRSLGVKFFMICNFYSGDDIKKLIIIMIMTTVTSNTDLFKLIHF